MSKGEYYGILGNIWIAAWFLSDDAEPIWFMLAVIVCIVMQFVKERKGE